MKKLPKKFIQREEKNAPPNSPKASAGKHKSPSIPRNIPEKQQSAWLGLATIRAHGQVLFVSFMCGVLLMGIGVVGIELHKNISELEKREALHQTLAAHQEYWKGVVAKYPDYKDAYFQLAVISYQRGESEEAMRAIGKVLEIDPNDVTGQEFAKKIRG